MTIVNKINFDSKGSCAKQDKFPIVHSSMKPNLETQFYGTDNEADFHSNCKRLPQEWIYRNKEVTYKFNSAGLRMNKELDSINTDYVIGFGCSHTVGVGVNLEDTWIHLLAQELGLDYINAGVSGGSVKLCAINFFNMLATVKQLPTAVAFAWPSSVRYCFYDNDEFVFYLPRFITDDKTFQYHTKIYNNMLMTNTLTTEALFYRQMVKATCLRLDIAYAEFTFDATDALIEHGITPVYTDPSSKDLNLDHARDVRDKTNNTYFSHPGIRTHATAKDVIIEQLRNK